MSERKFDDLFKQSFGNYSPDVPERIWENIAAARKKKRPVGFWLNKKAAVLMFTAALVILGGSAYLIFTQKENNPRIANESNGGRETDSKAIAAVAQPGSNNETATGNTNGQSQKSDNNLSAPDQTYNTTAGIEDRSSSKTTGNKSTAQSSSPQMTTGKPAAVTNGKTQARRTYKRAGKGNYRSVIDQGEVTSGEETNDTPDEYTQQGTSLPYVDGIRSIQLTAVENMLTKQTIRSFTPAVKSSEDCPGAPGKKYYIDAYISPDYAIKKYSDTGSSTLVAKRKESLRFHSAFSAGMRYTRVFSNGVSIRTGVNFSQINEKFSYAQDNVVQIIYVINTQGDTTDSYYVRGTRYKNSYNNYRTIDVPLVVGYELGNGNFKANINAGAVVNIYSWQKGETLDNNGNPVSITTGKGDNPYQYKTNVGMGFTAGASLYYKLNNRLYALAEPYFRYNFSPMNKEVLSIQEKFTTVGLRLGIRVDLK